MDGLMVFREEAIPCLDGLPVDCAMGSTIRWASRTPAALSSTGPGVDVFVGYSRDHDRNIGAGSFTASLGKGQGPLPLHAGRRLRPAPGAPTGMHPVLLRRLIANSIHYLTR